MGKLIYSMLMSLDGYVEDEQGRFGWGAPEDEEVHSCINQLASSVGTYLYGRRMYETMVYWETAHTVPNQPQFVLEWARQCQAAEKIVYSRTLAEPRSVRTRIEREFDPDLVRGLKADVRHDITVDGPELAARVKGWSRRVSKDRLPSGRRRRKTVFPGSCATEAGVGQRAPVPLRRGRSAVHRPWLRTDPLAPGTHA
jgi:dihydrofolate reductase